LLFLYVAWKVGERQWAMRQGKRMLAEEVAELDARDRDWRWDAIAAGRKPPRPIDLNSALLIPQIKALTAADWEKKLNELEYGRPELDPNVRLPEAIVAQIRRELAASAEAVELARSLKAMPRGQRERALTPDILGTVLKDSSNTSHASVMLSRAVIVATEDEDYSQVADDLVAALNASRSIGDDPFFFAQFVRVATRLRMVHSVECVLAQTVKPEQLQALRLAGLQKALADDLKEPLLLYGLRGERAAFAVLSERLQDGPVTELKCLGLDRVEVSPSDSMFAIGWWLYRGRMHADRAYVIAWYTLALRAAQKDHPEQRVALEALPLPPKGNPNHFLGNLLLPDRRRVVVRFPQHFAEVQCAVVGIACERFRLKHGKWPESLAALCPEFLPEVPVDPFDGDPMRYRKLGDGAIIHSAFGQPEPHPDAAVASFLRYKTRVGIPEGIEIGFRLWNPEARRQPAPPDTAKDNAP
jgi:hypothetical protein